jgi:hypothetical protein
MTIETRHDELIDALVEQAWSTVDVRIKVDSETLRRIESDPGVFAEILRSRGWRVNGDPDPLLDRIKAQHPEIDGVAASKLAGYVVVEIDRRQCLARQVGAFEAA